jgi:hypothetical protein
VVRFSLSCYFDRFVEVLKRNADVALSNEPSALHGSFMIDQVKITFCQRLTTVFQQFPAISRSFPGYAQLLAREKTPG